MDGGTLRLLDRLRAAGGSGTPDAQALEAFVLLVVGQTSVASSELWWVTSIVDDACAAGGADRAEPFRRAYAAAVDLPVSTSRSAPTGVLALEGMLSLPVPQRVALALSCILGFTSSEVGSVIGFPAEDVRTLLEDGIATIRAAARRDAGAGAGWSAA